MSKESKSDVRIKKRRLSIVKLLQLNEGLTFEDLSDKIGYSIATVRSDLEILYERGIVVKSDGNPIIWTISKSNDNNLNGSE